MKNIGKKFNRLLVLEIDQAKREEQIKQQKNKIRKFYNCQCDCGNIVTLRADSVQSGHVQSCGCLKLETVKKLGGNNKKDLTNQKFGKLTVLYQDFEYKGEKTKWICKCECGNITSVFASNLTRLHTTSCGCASRSIGEENIEKLLKENNIKYAKEYTFNDLKDIYPLRFDFAIFNDSNQLIKLIEYDGRQHDLDYAPWSGEDTLKDRKRRDEIKNEYCKKNNIHLLRIPYTYRDTITLELLGLE